MTAYDTKLCFAEKTNSAIGRVVRTVFGALVAALRVCTPLDECAMRVLRDDWLISDV